jgi:hypothetical protein
MGMNDKKSKAELYEGLHKPFYILNRTKKNRIRRKMLKHLVAEKNKGVVFDKGIYRLAGDIR